MNTKIKEILKICDEFLKIPSVVGYEKPFLNYLEKKIKKLGYETLLKKNYLVIKPKNNVDSRYLFSAHIDRHGLILNDSNKVEYGAFYLKKKLDLKFKPEINEEKEKDLSNHLKVNRVNFEFSDEYLKFEDFDLKFEKENTVSYIEKIAYRYVNDSVFSYDSNTGKKLSKFKILRYNQNFREN
nr:hypothetical protein [Candidatus Woesearchaeota archaeon]